MQSQLVTPFAGTQENEDIDSHDEASSAAISQSDDGGYSVQNADPLIDIIRTNFLTIAVNLSEGDKFQGAPLVDSSLE